MHYNKHMGLKMTFVCVGTFFVDTEWWTAGNCVSFFFFSSKSDQLSALFRLVFLCCCHPGSHTRSISAHRYNDPNLKVKEWNEKMSSCVIKYLYSSPDHFGSCSRRDVLSSLRWHRGHLPAIRHSYQSLKPTWGSNHSLSAERNGGGLTYNGSSILGWVPPLWYYVIREER